MYVAGWLKRGATGVIAATMYDAFETAEVIISDLQSNKPMLNGVASNMKPGATAILPLLAQRGIRTVSYKDWKKIEARESELGKNAILNLVKSLLKKTCRLITFWITAKVT